MANITVIRNLPATTTLNFLDARTKKVVATVTSTVAGPYSISVPPGQWIEQTVRTLIEPNGPSRVFTVTPSTPTDFETGNGASQLGPTITSPDGSVWILQVSNAGALTATKLV